MRLLVLLQGKTPEDQIGYHDGFDTLVKENALDFYFALPYGACKTPDDWNQLYSQAGKIVANHGIDTVLLQFFHGRDIPSPESFVQNIRKINPAIIVIATSGDGFGRFVHRVPASLLSAARVADLTFFTGMGYMAEAAVRAGARNVMLMPHGCCQVRFGPAAIPTPGDRREFDLLFIGSNYGGRNPFSHLSIAGRQRLRMVARLERRYGRRFVLFGRNWDRHPSWQGAVPFNEQLSMIQRARLVIGGFPGVRVPYYMSDRPFISMVSGVPFLDSRVPRVDRLFVADRDWYLYDDIDSLTSLIDRLLDEDPTTLNKNAQECRRTILARHTQYHRCKDMLRIANRLREHRQCGKHLAPQLPDCFHERVNLSEELPFAVLNWQG